MTKRQKSAYSITEAKSHLDKYLDVSTQRLRSRLKTARKKQSSRTLFVKDVLKAVKEPAKHEFKGKQDFLKQLRGSPS